MKTFIFGFVLASALLLGYHVYAYTKPSSGLVFIEKDAAEGFVKKYYDYDNGVVCYAVIGTGSGISCLHN